MRCRNWMLLVAILPVGAMGCGTSGEGTGGPAAAADAQEVQDAGTQEEGSAPLSGPAAAVYDFLEAVRTGDDQKAAEMLTTTARKKTAEMNMEVAPPGSDTASFQVGKVEYLPEGRASVACTWSDRDENDRRQTDEITWLLREEEAGWRVGGMVATIPGAPPTFLNFEDPQEMLRQQQLLQEEMRRRAARTQSQAERPQEPPTGGNPIRR